MVGAGYWLVSLCFINRAVGEGSHISSANLVFKHPFAIVKHQHQNLVKLDLQAFLKSSKRSLRQKFKNRFCKPLSIPINSLQNFAPNMTSKNITLHLNVLS